MPLKPSGQNDFGYNDSLNVTRAPPVRTPGAGQRYKDPIRGAQPDEFFAVGGSAQDISSKLSREASKRRNGGAHG
jgi:hypothetical protein